VIAANPNTAVNDRSGTPIPHHWVAGRGSSGAGSVARRRRLLRWTVDELAEYHATARRISDGEVPQDLGAACE